MICRRYEMNSCHHDMSWKMPPGVTPSQYLLSIPNAEIESPKITAEVPLGTASTGRYRHRRLHQF
ncbi:hypothetical protein L208DRAFT_876467 [Tricholoma matsutake]|nr:hypothetical protein L208DRAFT_876467 [Tricholoma matsutake 945]